MRCNNPASDASSLHRCLQRHGISQLPDVDGEKPAKKKLRVYPDRLLPYRYRRSADGTRISLPSPRQQSRRRESATFFPLPKRELDPLSPPPWQKRHGMVPSK
jgi:hypothetical protein